MPVSILARPKDPGVNASQSVAITVKDHGNLSLSVDPNTPNNIALANSTVKAGVFKLTATNEPYTVQTLTIKNVGDDAAVKTVKISYKDATGATVTSIGAVSNHLVKFTGLTLFVPTGASNAAVIEVFVDTADISNTGNGASGMTFSEAFGFLPGGVFKAIGMTSGNVITEVEMGVGYQGGTFTLRETRPTISIASSSPSGSAVVGRNEVIRFNVAASAGDDVVLNALTFKMSSNDNANTGWNLCGNTVAADFDIYDLYQDSSTSLDTADTNWTLMDSNGVACVSSGNVTFIRINLPTASVITKGTSHTFALYFDATGASSADDDVIRFDLPAEPLVPSKPLLKGMNWSDSTNTGVNIDGMYVKHLTANGGTLAF